jgi:hypothetical protein
LRAAERDARDESSDSGVSHACSDLAAISFGDETEIRGLLDATKHRAPLSLFSMDEKRIPFDEALKIWSVTYGTLRNRRAAKACRTNP